MILRMQGMRALLSGAVLLFAAAASAENLQQVEVRSAGEGARIVLQVDGVVTHKAFTLSNPDRLVVDLVGVNNSLKVGTRTVPGGPVKQVRVAQFATDPKPITRVVADLRVASDHVVQRQGDNVVVVVNPKGSKPVVEDDQVASDRAPEPEVAAVTSKPQPVKQAVAKDEDTVGQVQAVPVVPVQKAVTKSADSGKNEVEKSGAADAAGAKVEEPVSVESKPVGKTVATDVKAPVSTKATGEETKQSESSDKHVAESPKPVAPVQPQVQKPVAPRPVVDPVESSKTEQKEAVATAPKPVSARPVPQSVQSMPTVPVPASNAQSVRPEVGQTAGSKGTTTWRSQTGFEDTSPKLNLTTTSRRINLDVQGADIRTVLRTLADYAGMNIIASRDVQGEVSASLKDAPWESALESILRAHGYGYVQENGIIRVGLVEKIRNEALEEAAAARKREDLLPIETRVAHLEFANADELKGSLQEMMTARGNLQVDARTNALIITDIPNRVELIAQMAQQLDSRTPQVEIVSKIVDVSKTDARNLGIEWSATNIMQGDVIGSAGVSAPVPGAAGGLRLGTVQSWGQLDLMLDALASKKKANIISNPTITTVNNREAKILVGSKIPLIVADEAGNAITQLTTIGIQMRVTPHVNSDNTISLDLHPEISELSSQATVQGGVIINTSEADTRVIVDDGETAIIGGLIRDIESEVKTGIPVLQDIPLVGWLFRNSNITDDKRELIIFVTPRLINGEIGQG